MWNFFRARHISSGRTRTTNRCRPLFEALEERLACAGNVMASQTANGILHIRGDANDNAIRIYKVDANEWAVKGINRSGPTLINSHIFTNNFEDVKGITVVTYGGSDAVVLGSKNAPNYRTLTGNVLVRTGAGRDVVSVQRLSVQAPGNPNVAPGAKFVIDTSYGNDLVSIDYLHLRGTLEVGLGSGNDSMYLQNSYFAFDLVVFGGTNNDKVELHRFTAYGQVYVDMELGNDSLLVGDRTVIRPPHLVGGMFGLDTLRYNASPAGSIDSVIALEWEEIIQL